MYNINMSNYYEEISIKISNAIQQVDEILQSAPIDMEDLNDELLLEARFTKNMIQQVLDALISGRKLILAEDYEKRKEGTEKYYYASKMLTLIENQCKEMREKTEQKLE